MIPILSVQELLLNTKTLAPRAPGTDMILARIMRLKIDEWSEADVRAEIIDPLIQLLGYDKEGFFSHQREKPIEVLGAHKQIDYSMTLFAENFWLIEAKRPDPSPHFGRDALYQALRYAAHPDINAALLVLCDGNKIEVFDREETLKEPILSISTANLDRDFDKLRALLSPWQAFFFERRRAIRIVDKAFDHEVHYSRVEEFRTLLDMRLIEKRARIQQNSRERVDHKAGMDATLAQIRSAEVADIVEIYYFFLHNDFTMDVIASTVVAHAQRRPFIVTHRIFPARPRNANAAFWAHSLNYLIHLDKSENRREKLPHWLASADHTISGAICNLITLLLTNFANDPCRRAILLYSAAARRFAKLCLMSNDKYRDMGMLLHLFQRSTGDELTFDQAVSSPDRHLILALDPLEAAATAMFVQRLSGAREGSFVAAARHELQQLWIREISVLKKIPDWRALVAAQRDFEVHPTEMSAVVYDDLGHSTLCVLEKHPAWKSWTLANHRNLVGDLAQLGSWMAKKWLDIGADAATQPKSDPELASRFFFGNLQFACALQEGYGFRDEAANPTVTS